MTETRYYDPIWMGQWLNNGSYVGASSPIRVGGGGYNSLLGFPSQIREDIKKSKTPVTIRLSIYVTDAAEFDIGIHKQTYNKASNGIPQYWYAGLHPVLSNGRQYVNITNFPAGDRNTTYSNLPDALDDGYQGIVLYGGSNYGEAYGLTHDSYRVVIEVDGTWNQPPSAPIVTFPNGGETIVGKQNITWKPATDPEQPQSQLRYSVAVFDGSWYYFPLTGPGATSFEVDFSQFKETSVAKVAVRAFDSAIDYSHGSYGDWDYSDGVFTISRNIAPSTPTELKPSNGESINRAEIVAFSWRHNDTDSQSRFEIQWRTQGSSTWNTILKDTVEQFYYFGANTFPLSTIEWRVRTYDPYQLVSPWSAINVFKAVDPADLPTIISPTSGEVIGVSKPDFRWSAINQSEYEIEILSGQTVIWSDSKVTTNKAVTIGVNLENNMDYTFRLRIKNTEGLWSDWASVGVHTSFTPPPEPLLDIQTNNDRGSITIVITNPSPQEIEPNVKYNNVYRRKAGEIEWTLICEEVPQNFYCVDYSPASEQEYEYMVEAVGDNGTFIQSVPISAVIAISETIISSISDPTIWVGLKYNPSRSMNKDVNMELKKYQGRIYPLSEFGSGVGLDFDLSFTVVDQTTLDTLLQLVELKETLLYRDTRKRSENVVIPSISVTDKLPNKWEVKFSPVRVYKGG